MKPRLKRVLQSLLVNDLCWFMASPFVYAGQRLALSRENYKNRETEDKNTAICDRIFYEKIVLHGLFKGMRYNDIKATGSSLYAKLLGSYELELVPVIQKFLGRQYDYLVNIGSDEGYYAAGIALLLPRIHVIAFDCNREAQAKCKTLATINKVHDRVEVKGCFDIKELNISREKTKTLFIIDCEGCENGIMTTGLITQFNNADFIIELHYEQNPVILPKLNELFAATHQVTLIKALSDHERIMNYRFEELENLSYKEKEFILNERTGFMEWFIAESIL